MSGTLTGEKVLKIQCSKTPKTLLRIHTSNPRKRTL